MTICYKFTEWFGIHLRICAELEASYKDMDTRDIRHLLFGALTSASIKSDSV